MKKTVYFIATLFLITYSCTAPGGNKEILPAGLLADSIHAGAPAIKQEPKKDSVKTISTDSLKQSSDSVKIQNNNVPASSTDSVNKK